MNNTIVKCFEHPVTKVLVTSVLNCYPCTVMYFHILHISTALVNQTLCEQFVINFCPSTHVLSESALFPYHCFPVFHAVPQALPVADTFICNTVDGEGLK